MKIRGILVLAVLMALTYMGLMLLQWRFFREFEQLRTQTFDMGVLRCMGQCVHNVDRLHTLKVGDALPNESELEHELALQFENGGIQTPFLFSVVGREGRTLCTNSPCDSLSHGADRVYSMLLLQRPPVGGEAAGYPDELPVAMRSEEPFFDVYFLRVVFPQREAYIAAGSCPMKWISLFINFLLLMTFVATIWLIVRQKRMAEEKTDFINNMTHEFKTPIASISLAGQMLADERISKTPEMLKSTSQVIRDETQRLRFLVEKVLQTSLLENERPILNFVEADINALVTTVAGNFTFKVKSRGGRISTRLDAQNPRVLVDELQFSNVLYNLMDNAVKYAKTTEPLHLQVCTRNENDRTIVEIEDNGMGIPKEDLKKIFDKFYRIHTGNVHNVKGFGLGLAYVKRMVSKHRGHITVESEIQKGTKFILSIPTLNNA